MSLSRNDRSPIRKLLANYLPFIVVFGGVVGTALLTSSWRLSTQSLAKVGEQVWTISMVKPAIENYSQEVTGEPVSVQCPPPMLPFYFRYGFGCVLPEHGGGDLCFERKFPGVSE